MVNQKPKLIREVEAIMAQYHINLNSEILHELLTNDEMMRGW
ncbi:hypothetical protein [Melghiribacillus thermohalophilus]|nr:hypothetical protein [Melghiribacillus thermohalophilus]